MARYSTIVKAKREEMQLTQYELARESGVSASTLSKFESGDEVSEVVVKSIRYSIRKLEDAMPEQRRLCYDLKVQARLATSETNPETIKKKLDGVIYACLRYRKYLDS